MSNTTFAPSFTAARLFEKTSAKGNTYLTGRMGSIRVTLMKSRETAEDGSPIWEMKFAEAPPYQPKSDGKPARGSQAVRDHARPLETAQRGAGTREPSAGLSAAHQEIPF